jgi:hypothetical protein
MHRSPIAALRREKLKYAHRNRRGTPTIRENRGQLADHIAAIQPEPVPKPTGERLPSPAKAVGVL